MQSGEAFAAHSVGGVSQVRRQLSPGRRRFETEIAFNKLIIRKEIYFFRRIIITYRQM